LPLAGRWRVAATGLVAAAAFAAITMSLPRIVGETHAAVDASRLASRPDELYRQQTEGVPFDLLWKADREPADATVLLVTDGSDVRIREYTTFHRALYFLAPRSVYWMTSVPSDGTWESRSWATRDLSRDSICGYAADVGATALVLLDVLPPEPPCDSVTPITGTGTIVRASGSDGQLSRALLALGFALLIGLGVAAFAARGWTVHSGLWLGAAWTIGAGFTSLVVVALTALDAGHLLWIVGAAAALAALGVVVQLTRPVLLPATSWIGGSLVAVTGAFVAFVATSRPLTAWDGWAIWGFKARTMFLEGGFRAAQVTDQALASTHPGYPLNLPALETWLFVFAGTADDRLVGLVSAMTFVALLAVVFGALRHWGAGCAFAAAAVAVLGSMFFLWNTALAGMADVPLALLATVAAVFLVEWLDNGRRGALVVAAVTAGLMPWTKMEGWVVLLVLAAVAFVARRGRRGLTAAGALLGAAVVIAGPWYVFVAANHVVSADYQLSVSVALANLDRLPKILALEARYLVNDGTSFLWPAAVAVTAAWLLARRRPESGSRWLLAAFPVAYLALMSAAYLVTTFQPYTAQIVSSAYRIALHVLPIAFIWTCLCVRDLLGSDRSSAATPLPGASPAPSPELAAPV
jgi:hypothetical protein